MKLALCLFKFFPYGGLQRDFLRIARVLHERGHEIHVYTTQWEGERDPFLTLHQVECKGWQNHQRLHSFAANFNTKVRNEHYDLIIGFNKMPGLNLYYAADVCYQTRVLQKHGFLYRLSPRYRQYLTNEKVVFSRGQKTEILLLSSLQQKEFEHCYQTERERFHLLPPGIAKDRVAPENANEIRNTMRKSLGLQEQDFLLLMVGSGFKTKGLDRAIHALSSLPKEILERCQLYVIGQDHAQPFQKLAKKLQVNNRLHFLGGRSDVSHFMLAADLLLHPAYHENTGTVLLEAIVSGLPVLASDRCGYAHYIHAAQAGKVVSSPFNQHDLNAMLLQMLTTNEREIWHKNGLQFAKHADIYSMPEKVADIIEQTATTKNSYHKMQYQNHVMVNSDLKKYFSPSQSIFSQMMSLSGECFRKQNGRITQRLSIGDRGYFIKQHFGVGWKEIFKNLLQLRTPILSAKNEWLAIEKLQSLGISVPEAVAFGLQGKNPARLQSFILMEELTSMISLEDLCKTWKLNPPPFSLKRKLIESVAHIARVMHQNGLNHRDFYLCHFLLKQSAITENNSAATQLTLIDLHRAQIRPKTPQRWIIKDLSGLYFSCQDIGLTKRDLYRFLQIYCSKKLRDILMNEKKFWQKVENRGITYCDHTK